MTDEELGRWFVDQVLRVEPQLMRFLRRNWRESDEVDDLRQEVYARAFDHCRRSLPESPLAFVLSVAKHLLIDRARRKQIVSIETYADIEALEPTVDELSPERHQSARSELQLLQLALDALPERCRQVVALRKIEGLSQREVAARLGITEDTVERQVSKGVRALAKALADGGTAISAEQAQASAANRRQL